MANTYVQTDTSGDLNHRNYVGNSTAGGGEFQKKAIKNGTPGVTALAMSPSIAVVNGSTTQLGTNSFIFEITPGVGNWPGGQIAVSINVSVSNMNIDVGGCHVVCVQSDGTVRSTMATSYATTFTVQSTGVSSYTFTTAAVPGAIATDKCLIIIGVQTDNAMAVQSFAILPNQNIVDTTGIFDFVADPIAGSDSLGIGVTDTAAAPVVTGLAKSAVDGAAISVAETASVVITSQTKSATDGAGIAVGDSSSIFAQGDPFPARADAATIAVSETSAVRITTTDLTIVDGDFETGMRGWYTSDGCTIYRGPTNATGNYALQVEQPPGGNGGANRAYSNYFPVTPGKFYRGKARVSGRGNATLGVTFFDANYNVIGGSPWFAPDYSGGGMLPLTMDALAPAGAVYGQINTMGVSMIGGYSDYNSISQVDDVTISEFVQAGLFTIFDDFYAGYGDMNGRQTQVGGKTWVGTNMVTNGEGIAKGAPNGAGVALVDTGMTDGTITVNYRTGASLGEYSGFSLRHTDQVNWIKLEQDGNGFRMAKIVGNVETTIFVASGVFAPSTTYSIRIEMYGASIKVFVNNVQTHNYTITDSILLAGTNVRMYVNYNTDYQFDNFMFAGPRQVGVIEDFTNGIPADVVKGGSTVLASSFGNPAPSIQSTGLGDGYWYFTDPKWSVAGDFDLTQDVYLNPGGREICNLAFWVTNPGATAHGYMYRLDSSTPGGFFDFSSGIHGSTIYGSEVTFPSSTWYRTRLQGVASTGTVSVTVTRLSDSVVVHSQSGVVLPAGNRSGTFGRKQDGLGGPQSYQDNIALGSGSNTGGMDSGSIAVTETASVTVLVGAARVEDDFTGPDSTNSVAAWQGPARKTPIGGKTWVQNPVTVANIGINNNRMYFNGQTFVSLDVGTPEVVTEVDYTTGATLGDAAGLMVRGNTHDMSTCMQIHASAALGGSWYFLKTVNEGGTNLGHYGSCQPNTTYKIRIVTRGAYIGVSIDGVHLVSTYVTEPELLTGNRVGITNKVAGGTDHYFDNFKVTALGANISDDFTAPNGTPLNGRLTPVGGKTWTAPAFSINNNQTSATNGDSHAALDAGVVDGVLEVDITTAASLDTWSDGAGVTFRAHGATGGYYSLALRASADGWRFIHAGDAPTTYGPSGTVSPNTTYRVKVVMVGTSVKTYVNGTLMFDYTTIEPQFLAATNLSIHSKTTDHNAKYDNFSFSSNPSYSTGTENTNIGVAESASVEILTVAKVGSDTAAISVTDAAVSPRVVSSTRTDTAAITVTESTAMFKTIVATDAATIAVSETRAQQASFARTDTASLAVTEGIAFGPIMLSSTDTGQVAVADLSFINTGNQPVGNESTAIQIAETYFLVKTGMQVTDGAAITVTETAGIFRALAATDTGSVAVTESRSLAVQISTVDSASITITEARALFRPVTSTETIAITVTEATSSFRTLATTDTSSIAVVEAGFASLTKDAQDGGSISVSESTDKVTAAEPEKEELEVLNYAPPQISVTHTTITVNTTQAPSSTITVTEVYL